MTNMSPGYDLTTSCKQSSHENHLEIPRSKKVENGLQLITEEFQLSPRDFKEREDIVRDLIKLFAPYYPVCRVYQFGSSVNGFGMQGCDLDLFLDLDLPQTRNPKVNKRWIGFVYVAKIKNSGAREHPLLGPVVEPGNNRHSTAATRFDPPD
ncbi:histone-lysine N-methyltransferase SETMAR [Plakobranchus ocellatus]|uniref:Histone-lysine N-methyltransferase SETMAR n=1 Tax=Plakobranchus ocellatus TaxID=259542 RepID=A0AAV4A2E9_9GAST|nr:histone-lysine N-methyltransferase SETMAR [Plakobranchus ocellatus]